MNDMASETNKVVELKSLLVAFMTEVLRYDTDEILRLLKREDLSMARIGALHVVKRRGSVSISEIGSRLDLSLGNTSMLVDKLVCSGFVSRAEDAQDRRHKVVKLTEKGQILLQEFQETRVETIVQRMLLLPPDLLDQAIDILGQIMEELPPTRVNQTTDHS
jgi:DNA-binding MarR family transcriptional regulator